MTSSREKEEQEVVRAESFTSEVLQTLLIQSNQPAKVWYFGVLYSEPQYWPYVAWLPKLVVQLTLKRFFCRHWLVILEVWCVKVGNFQCVFFFLNEQCKNLLHEEYQYLKVWCVKVEGVSSGFFFINSTKTCYMRNINILLHAAHLPHVSFYVSSPNVRTLDKYLFSAIKVCFLLLYWVTFLYPILISLPTLTIFDPL